MSEAAVIGHNRPPTDQETFVERLEDANGALTAKFAALDRDKRKLPAEVKTAEDLAAVNAWVVRARALAREAETRRVEVKAPYLERERWVDEWFGDIKKTATTDAATVEKRGTAYLLAEKARAQALADAAAAAARLEAQRIADEAAAAQAAAAEATRVRQAAEDKLRAEAAALKAPAAAAEAPTPANDHTAPLPDAAEALRVAHQDAGAAEEAADALASQARVAELAASRLEQRAAEPSKLGRAVAGGASSRVNMVWVGKIRSYPRLLQSLGECGPYFLQADVDGMVARAAKAKQRPEIPGVEWLEEPEVKTTAARATKEA